jgi:DNA-binding GntR family transcriptional regulator
MTIVVRTLSDQTYELVRKRILLGQMAPGTPVRQDTIAEELGVSKIPLREALSRLEQDGLLSSYPNRGYVVRPLSVDEAHEVFDLRLKLEPSATAAGARKARPEDQQRVQTALAALETAQKSGAPGDHVSMNRAFHMAMIKPAGGLVTYQLLERLQVLAERYVRVHLEPYGREARAAEEHRELLEAWLKGDDVRVEALTAAHIRSTMRDLQHQLS